MPTTPTLLNHELAHDLAGDLLRQLVQHIGDAPAVEAEIAHWLDTLGVPALAQVCLSAVQRTFSECLTDTHPYDWPANGLAFNPNRETDR